METEQAPEPQSTMDIAEQIVSQDESQGIEGGDGSIPESTPESPAAPVAPPTQAEISAAAKFLQSQGHKIHKDDGKPNWLPAPTVEKMLARFYEQESAGWNTRYTGLETEHKTLKEKAENYIALVELAERDPDAFVKFVADHDERWKKYAQPTAPQQVDEEPQPDIDLGNGRSTYSLDQMKKREEWRERQILAKWEAKQKEEAQKQTQAQQREQQRRQVLEDAQTWPDFGKFAADGTLTPFQQEVYDYFKANKNSTLKEAYWEVRSKKLASAEGEAREKLVKDINAAPTSTSVPRSAGVVPTTGPKRRSTEDIAREIVSRSE